MYKHGCVVNYKYASDFEFGRGHPVVLILTNNIQYFSSDTNRFIYTECPGENVPDFGRMFLTLKYTDLTQNTYIRSWTVTEIMAREKCGLLAVSRIVTRTLRMSVPQSHSRVKHIPTSLSTDVTVTVNCNSILLDIHVPCKVLGTLRTTATLVRVFM